MNKELSRNDIVFDKFWFQKHQKLLLWLANSWLGKYIFGFEKMGHYLIKDRPIIKITPESVHQYLGIRRQITTSTGKQKRGVLKPTFQAQFFGTNVYAKRLYFVLLPMWWAMHIWDLLADSLAPQLSFGFSTLTANPVSGANSPCDGYIEYYANATWSTVHDATDGTSASVTTTGPAVLCSKDAADGYYIDRGFLNFDTSALGASANISAAVLSVAGTGVAKSNSDTTDVDVVSATPAGTNTLTTADYDQVGSTPFASKAIADYVTTAGTYNDFTLDANGIANIAKTGISKYALRIAKDTDNVAPGVGAGNKINFRAADFGTEPPKLVITYTTSTAWTKELTETITITDVLSKTATRILTETLTITDTLSKTATRILSETITITDTVIKTATRLLSETLTITDDLTSLKIKNLVVEEIVTITDTLSKTATRILTETLTITDTVIKTATRILSEAITITDDLTKIPGKVLSEVVTITDSIIKTATRILSETVTITDSLVKTATRVLSETLTISDIIVTSVTKFIGFIRMRSRQQDYPKSLDSSNIDPMRSNEQSNPKTMEETDVI